MCDAGPLLCAGVTTFNALRNSGARPGDTVAVQGMADWGTSGSSTRRTWVSAHRPLAWRRQRSAGPKARRARVRRHEEGACLRRAEEARRGRSRSWPRRRARMPSGARSTASSRGESCFSSPRRSSRSKVGMGLLSGSPSPGGPAGARSTPRKRWRSARSRTSPTGRDVQARTG